MRGSLLDDPPLLCSSVHPSLCHKPADSTVAERYLLAMFWSVGLVTGMGSDITPTNHTERHIFIGGFLHEFRLNILLLVIIASLR